MEYKLFDDYITLQSLLKDQGIIQTGGAIKMFLSQHTVLLNGIVENRRGKKLFIGDCIEIPDFNILINLIKPNDKEMMSFKEDLKEKERISRIVNEMNKQNHKNKKVIRFPGT